mmetsp:Transcript_45907/g.116597  ORF Transcript_45907/g.116597 Transcript_45907/m.116597 type:complete len:87 (+) Transcript_45907:110-370(+)
MMNAQYVEAQIGADPDDGCEEQSGTLVLKGDVVDMLEVVDNGAEQMHLTAERTNERDEQKDMGSAQKDLGKTLKNDTGIMQEVRGP